MANRLERPGDLLPVPRPRDWPLLKLGAPAAALFWDCKNAWLCCGDTSALCFSSVILPVNPWSSTGRADGKDCTGCNCWFFVTIFSLGLSLIMGELDKSWGLNPKSLSVCSKLKFLGCCLAAVVICCCWCWDLDLVCVFITGSVRGGGPVPAAAPVWVFAASWNWPGDSTGSAGEGSAENEGSLAPDNLFLLSLLIGFRFLFVTTLSFGADDRDCCRIDCCWIGKLGGPFLIFLTLTLFYGLWYGRNYKSASPLKFQTFLFLPLAIFIKLFNGDPPGLSAFGFACWIVSLGADAGATPKFWLAPRNWFNGGDLARSFWMPSRLRVLMFVSEKPKSAKILSNLLFASGFKIWLSVKETRVSSTET